MTELAGYVVIGAFVLMILTGAVLILAYVLIPDERQK